MDFQFWVWLIVIVITLIARANKKKPPEGIPSDEAPDGPPQHAKPNSPKALSFEDLLREIQGEKTKPRPVPAPMPPKRVAHKYVDYDDDLQDEEQDLEEVGYEATKDDKSFQTYEAAKKLAFERPSLEKSNTSGGDTIVKFDQFKGYEKRKKQRASFNFIKELKDPNGFKKAFIMSEILKRKY